MFISSHVDLILKGKVKMETVKNISHMFLLPSYVNLKALCELSVPKTSNSRN